MKRPKKLLMVAYHFPPLGGAGALRPLKMAKYLPDFGWDPIVLTVKNPDWYYARDEELLTEISPAAIVRTAMLRSAWLYRIANPLRIRRLDLFLRRWLVHPDDQIGWFPFAVRRAARLIEEEKVSVLYSTSAPLTAHLIALHLARRFQIPWIADFRDEWLENPDLPLPTACHRRLHERLEAMIVHNATKVIVAAPVFGRYLAKHRPDDNKISTITMGFDPDDFPATAQAPPGHRNRRFTIAFSGLFYGSFRPDSLLRAINTLIERGQVEREAICLRFIGANTPQDVREPDPYGLCEFTGFLPHERTLRWMEQSDALLLLLSRERGQDVIPSKTFEYMALGKPVLALVPADGAVAGIIRGTGIGVVAEFGKIPEIADAVLSLYRQWLADSLTIHPNASRIDAFSYVNLTRQFASLLDEVVRRPAT